MDKPKLKTNLKKDTKVFITFRDLFCNTDEYVLRFLYNKIKSGSLKLDYLDALVQIYDIVPKEAAYVIPYGKKHFNPIMDFVDYDKVVKCDYIAVMDDMYNEILYNDKSNIFEGLQMTNIATALAPLLNDDLLTSFTIQVDKLTDAIYTYIYNRFAKVNASKVHIKEGSLKDALTTEYDDYFLPHANYIDKLCIKRDTQIDVVIPELSTTLVLDEKGNPQIPRKLKLKYSPVEYRTKYAMNILSIKIPI